MISAMRGSLLVAPAIRRDQPLVAAAVKREQPTGIEVERELVVELVMEHAVLLHDELRALLRPAEVDEGLRTADLAELDAGAHGPPAVGDLVQVAIAGADPEAVRSVGERGEVGVAGAGAERSDRDP